MLRRDKDSVACNIKLRELEILVNKWETLRRDIDQAVISGNDETAKKLKEEEERVKEEVSKVFTDAILVCDTNQPLLKKVATLLKESEK